MSTEAIPAANETLFPASLPARPVVRRRVAVTGWGALSSLGSNMEQIATALRAGTSGVRFMPAWRDLGLRSQVAAPVHTEGTRETSSVAPRRLDTMGLVSEWCTLAAEKALASSGWLGNTRGEPSFGCILGSGVGSMPTIYEGATRLYSGQARRISPFSVLQSMSSAVSAHVVQAFSISGRSYSLSSACATSAHAIGHAFELIREGRLTAALAGGAEQLDDILGAAFDALRGALSCRYNEDPERASRPFDRLRDGFVLSGGAGAVVLEEYEHATRRGAPILGEVLGFGAVSDCFDPIRPDPTGQAALACMRAALADAGLGPEAIGAIKAHATSTPAGDRAEAIACCELFDGQPPPITAPKALAGHALGAAGALECIYSWLMMAGNFLAPAPAAQAFDEGFENFPLVRLPSPFEAAPHLCNSFGFGGANATLVLGPNR